MIDDRMIDTYNTIVRVYMKQHMCQ